MFKIKKFKFKADLDNISTYYSLIRNKIKINRNMSKINNTIFDTHNAKIINNLKYNSLINKIIFSLLIYSKIRKCDTFTGRDTLKPIGN